MARAEVVIEVSEEQAIRDIEATNTAVKQMDTGLQRTGRTGNVVFTGITRDTERANRAASILQRTLGINLPRGFDSVLAKSRLIGPALAAAFNVSIILAVGAALVALGPKIRDLAQELGGFTAKMKELNDEIIRTIREALAGFSTREVGEKLLAQTLDRIKALEGERDAVIKLRDENAKAFGPQGVALALGYALRLRAINNELGGQEGLIVLSEKQRQRLTELAKKHNEAASAAGGQADSVRRLREEVDGFLKLPPIVLLTPEQFEANAQMEALAETIERQNILRRESVSILEQLQDQNLRLVLESLEGEAKVRAELELKLAELVKIKNLYQAFPDIVAAATGQEVLLHEQAQREINRIRDQAAQEEKRRLEEQAREQQRVFEELAGSIEGFFNRLFQGGNSFKNFWRNLLGEVKQLFFRAVSEMIARWLLGMKQMQGAGAGGAGGGGIGSILGTIFGIPGGVGGTPSTFPGTTVGAGFFPSGGLGAQTSVAGTPSTFPGGGGGSATNISGLEKILELFGIKLHGGQFGPALASGGLLALMLGLQSGSPLGGAIGGGLGGAALGFAFGGPLGALFGGIGGGIAGLFAGILGRGKKKRQASAIADVGFAEMRRILDDYKKFQVEFQSALSGIDSLWAGMVEGWQQIGGSVGRRSIRTQEPFYKQIRDEIQRIQKIRDQRLGVIEGLPIPEFAMGGFVGQMSAIHSTQGKLLAFLHQGEAVLNARAVQRLGPSFIQQANRAPSMQSGGFVGGSQTGMSGPPINIYVLIVPSAGMDEQALGAAAAREIERRLRDRGRRL